MSPGRGQSPFSEMRLIAPMSSGGLAIGTDCVGIRVSGGPAAEIVHSGASRIATSALYGIYTVYPSTHFER
jgi:hypothetical protein